MLWSAGACDPTLKLILGKETRKYEAGHTDHVGASLPVVAGLELVVVAVAIAGQRGHLEVRGQRALNRGRHFGKSSS